MLIAAVVATGQGSLDTVLTEVATELMAEGLHLAGVVQTNCTRPDRHNCDMDVKVLPDGPVIRISQDLGPEARGCRLDPAALEQAVALVAARLAHGADLMVLNKFGKHEADGRGFRDLIGEALSRGIPVLTGVNAMNRAAFEAFADGTAELLPADADAIRGWMRRAGVAVPA